MPGAQRRSRRAATQPPLVLGFAGSGELSQKATVALLDDLIEGRTVQMVILPLTKDDTTDEIIHVQRWCVEKEIPYEVVSNEDEVAKDKALKKILEGAAGDYAVSEQGAGRDIVELLTPENDKDETEYQLLMFMDVEVEEDITVFEHTEEHDVQAFDLRDNLSPLTHEDGEPEPEPEPVDEVSARRGRRKAAAEPVDPEHTAEENGYTTAEQKEYDKYLTKDFTLVELKKMVKALDSDLTTEDLKGTDKAYVADLIIMTKRNVAEEATGEPADEAQQVSPPTRRRRGSAPAEEAPEPSGDGDDAEDPKEAVFARLRGSREASERIAAGMAAVSREKLGLDDEEIEIAAGIFAGALMLFADFIITEVRKPKSAGRPRKDGTEAQPKPPVDPDAPKRGRGRPRKDANE